jgi:predicted porin
MNKIIPAALLALVAGAAQAELSIYGLIDLNYGKNIADDAAGKSATFHSGGDDGSSQGNSTTRFGIKGSTEVATGTKVNFKLESSGITSDGRVGSPGAAFFGRAAWAGLSSIQYGEVRLGRQDSVAFQTMIDFDLNGAANNASAYGNSAVAAWWPGRQSRSLQYIAPKFGDFKLQLGYVPKDSAPGTASRATGSIGLTWATGPVAVAVTSATKDTDAGHAFTSVAGSYDLGVAKFVANYTDGGMNLKGYGVGVSAPIAGFTVGAQYGKNSDTKVSAYELFANREVFKNTYAYLDIGHADKTAGYSTKGNGYSLGMIYVF